MKKDKQRAGFIAVVGKPNAGKSSLLNWLVDEKIAMVSQKANATRKRANIIVMHEDTQFIFVDTPGIHKSEKLLNKFMIEETSKALNDCDLTLFLSPVTDSLQSYKEFLKANNNKPHIVILSKCDTVKNEAVLNKITEFQEYQSHFLALLLVSVKHAKSKTYLLNVLKNFIPEHPYFYDPEFLSTQMLKDIYAEYIREAVFKFTNDEVPYSANVIIDKIEKKHTLDKISATIICAKEGQKNIIIGSGGTTLKKIGFHSRVLIEKIINKKILLIISVIVNKNWTKNEKIVAKLGYL